VAYTGVLRRETAGEIHGYACDYCGLKAETTKCEPPQEWLNGNGNLVRFSGGYRSHRFSDLFCTKRCHAKWNKLPWPPVKDEAEVNF
jgi:hypothetical protein